MNKKKKKTRIKHRKNQERVKKILHVSMLKAKPKNILAPTKVEIKPEVSEKSISKKMTPKKTTTKKVAAKKTTTKKTTTKKVAAKKPTTKKTITKK